ncbi:MAG: efflux RND transporter permease subunit [Armatimonadetes bacterium]|nr:efflux RND transporter permease subunit [Armatimonadota bacterium]
MGLTKVAITRPMFIFMLMAAAVLLGLGAYNGLHKEENPDVSFGTITITTVYPGAGSEEINELVSRPIEESVSSVANVQEVTSTSQEGVSTVAVRLNIGSNENEALNDVRSKVDGVIGQLPRDVEKPIVQKFDTSSSPVVTLSLKSKSLSNRQIRDLAENTLKDRFARVNGVAQVEVSGGEEREIQIRVRKDDLLRYKLGITDIQRAVQSASLDIPSGKVVTDKEEFAVRVKGQFKTIDEIGDLWLTFSNKQDNDGLNKTVRLRDVATIVDTNAERTSYSRLNGSEAVTISIAKAKAGNAVEISKAIREKPDPKTPSLLETLSKNYGVEFEVTADTSETIGESLFDLQFALGFGIVLVMVVVWLFLHNFRGTMIVALAIPTCIFVTFLVYSVAGFTINNMSMLALSLAVGVLVDDAIVVIENIYRHLTMGEDPVDAAINGRSEIGLAAIAITLVDVVVWLPIGFMGGVVGQFFKPLGLGFATCVMASLFVSFTVTPMLASRWYKQGEDWEHPKGRFAHWFEDRFHAFSVRYRNTLEWSLRHRWPVFAGGWTALVAVFMFIGGSFADSPAKAIQGTMMMAILAFLIGFAVWVVNVIKGRRPSGSKLLVAAAFAAAFPLAAVVGYTYKNAYKHSDLFNFVFIPPSDSASVNLTVDLPPGASLKETQRVVERLEAAVSKHPEAKYVLSRIGRRGSGFGSAQQGTNYAAIAVTLYDKMSITDRLAFWVKHKEHLREVSDTAVAADMLQMIGKVPGANVTVSAGANQGFGKPIQMSFRGDNHELLLATATKIQKGLASGAVEGVISPDVSSKPGKPELVAKPDRARLGDVGLTTADIGAALRVMYEGDIQSKYRVNGREYDMRVMMDRADRDDPSNLARAPIAFKSGAPVFLSDVTDLERGQAADKVDRRDRQEEVTVTADLLPGKAAGTVQDKINKWMADERIIPEGVQYKPLGQADVQNREMGYLLTAFGLGIVLVYMVLASLYNNLLYPFIIQLAQPQAMVGALLALVLTDKPLNIVGFVGIIALVGIVGKNAILLVDFANTLRERGEDRHTALCDSGQTRLRPIMMTTLALIFGMLPVALAIGRGSEFRETIGITIIGGVMLSTFLTLLVIPCSYTIFDDLSQWNSARRRRRTNAPVVAPDAS